MKLRAHLGVFLVCLGLIALWTWPLARDPAHLVPDNTDPRLFSWVMISVFRNLVTRPSLLLHGSAFYPHGLSLTFAEPLVTPALLAAPLYGVLGNPYLAYNLTLLLFWAASGWAMYAVTHGITRCHPAAAAAMLVFTLAPPRIQYAVEFQMEILFGLPLAVYALVRYFETQRPRYLIAFLVVFWLQAIAVWYFAVILGLGLVVLALSYALRHWSGWRGRTMLASAAGVVALGAALAPVAWPFFVTRAELGLQRGTGDAVGRSADVLSYVTTDGIWLGKLIRISHGHETSLFPGLVAYGLAGLAMIWLRSARAETARGWPERLATIGIAASAILGRADRPGRGAHQHWLGVDPVACRSPPAASRCSRCLLLRDALAGWRRWQAGLATGGSPRASGCRRSAPWALLALLLSLGPVVPVAGVADGLGSLRLAPPVRAPAPGDPRDDPLRAPGASGGGAPGRPGSRVALGSTARGRPDAGDGRRAPSPGARLRAHPAAVPVDPQTGRAPSTRSSGRIPTTSPCSSGRSTTPDRRRGRQAPHPSGTASASSTASPDSTLDFQRELSGLLRSRRPRSLPRRPGPPWRGSIRYVTWSCGIRGGTRPGLPAARPRRSVGRLPPVPRLPWARRPLRDRGAAGARPRAGALGGVRPAGVASGAARAAPTRSGRKPASTSGGVTLNGAPVTHAPPRRRPRRSR